MSKLKIVDKKSEKSINSEREFLSKLRHPFIVNMHYAFQDNDNLYLVMDMLSGGDLRYHITKNRRFSEEQTRFFIGCIIIALEYIHNNNVIHRDIKPENLVLDDKGYVRVTDFGIAKENCEDNSSETSGTPGYMSPEVMVGKNHSFPVDFFAIGVIGFEFMNGVRPYVGRNKHEIKEQMFSKQVMIKTDDIRQGWSLESADFINLLLKRKPSHRLGFQNGAKELMDHPWLKYYPWKELKEKTLPSPFIPDKKDNFDRRYCESKDKIGESTKMRYEEILFENDYQQLFIHFKYNKEEIAMKAKKNNNNYNDRINVNKSKKYSSSNHLQHNLQQSMISDNSKIKPPSSRANNKANVFSEESHNRPLSHSYSTKNVKLEDQKKYMNRNNNPMNQNYLTNLTKSRKALMSPIHNENSKVTTNNTKKSNEIKNKNLLSFLINNNKKTGASKTHVRSTSQVNSSNKKTKEYSSKLANGKNRQKEPKKRLNRAESASSLFNNSISQYLLNKIKSISSQKGIRNNIQPVQIKGK